MDKESPPKDNEQGDPVFYYSREHRLSRASKRVREMNDEAPFKRSFIGTLFRNKGNVFLLASLLMICVMFVISSRYSGREKGINLAGNMIEAAIFRDGDVLILSIEKKTVKRGEVYIGDVDLAVSQAKSELDKSQGLNVFSHRVTFNPVDKEDFFLTLPFDGTDFFVILKAGDKQKSFRINAKQ